MTSSFILFTVFLFLQLSFFALASTTYGSVFRSPQSTDVDDLTRLLFSTHDDPLADEDRWAALTDSQREAWTASNEVIRFSHPIRDVLNALSHLRATPMLLHVDVQIVAPQHFFSVHQQPRIARYATAMMAKSTGTKLHFNVSFAPTLLFKRLSMHTPSKHPSHFMPLLEQTAATLGSTNVMYVIINDHINPISDHAPRVPFVGAGRTSCLLYSIHESSQLVIAPFLTTIEQAAQRVYAPEPLYFPVPFIKTLTVDVSAYTPGFERRARWLRTFDWDLFESSIQKVSVNGQHLRFSSSQVNSECYLCENAFHDTDRPPRDFVQKAASKLNYMLPFNSSWSKGLLATTLRRTLPPSTFRMYVLDVFRLRKTESIKLLESKPLYFNAGMGILTLRSTDNDTVAMLDVLFAQAFVAAVYGISEPSLYHSVLRGTDASKQQKPSLIMTDVVSRYLVRSILEQGVDQLEEIMNGMSYFDIDPAQSLSDMQYAYFSQRINFFLYKLEHSQRLLAQDHDSSKGIYMAASTVHDIRAIRAAFDLEEDGDSFDQFRDPTLRCHFSRLKREALKASQYLESSYSTVRLVVIFVFTLLLSAGASYFSLWRYTIRKRRGKRE